MSYFTDHPAARWTLPVAALGVVGAAALTINQTAGADTGLPPRTATQLLADVRSSNVSSLSGTVVQTSDLGLPQLPGLSTGMGGSSSSSLTSLVSGTHTWRVWLDGPTRQRLALVGSNGESDVIHNGNDLWLWSSSDKTAIHHRSTDSGTHPHGSELPSGPASGHPSALPSGHPTGLPGPLRSGLPSGAPRTPDEAAQAALAMMGADSTVTTSGAATVAGRSAYELVLTPKDSTTLVSSVRIAIDAEKHVPTRVQVFSTRLTSPAFEVGFTALDFAKPDARQFAFTPPSGTKVTESDALMTPKGDLSTNRAPSTKAGASGAPKLVGTGWSTVAVAPFTLPPAEKNAKGSAGDIARQLSGMLKALPKTSGTWGSGHVLQGTLFSVVLTDDGRVAVGAVGAVEPAQLYAALAAK